MLRELAFGLTIRTWNVNDADLKTSEMKKGHQMDKGAGNSGGEALLFLTDEQLRRGIEALFFAYRGFTGAPDQILDERGYGRAHHRAVHFVNRAPGTTVNNLLGILGVTKQSLNRILRTLLEDGLIESRVGPRDKRERHLYLTPAGIEFERALSDAQRRRLRAAYRSAGPVAVAGFRQVLEALMDEDQRAQYQMLWDGKA